MAASPGGAEKDWPVSAINPDIARNSPARTVVRTLLLAAGLGLLSSPALAAAAAASEAGSQAQSPQVSDAWVRLPAVKGRPAGGFFILQGGAQNDALVSVSSPQAERVEMHETVTRDGRMSMQARNEIGIPAGAQVEFVPGGHHLMLFGTDAELRPDEQITLVLRFRSGQEVTVKAATRAPSAMPPGRSGPHRHSH